MFKRYSGRWRRLGAALSAAGLLWAHALAVDPPEPHAAWPPITDLSGNFSASYHYSGVQGGNVSYGGGDGVLDGLTFGVGLSFDLGDLAVELAADNLSLSRQQLTLSVRGDRYTGRLTYSNIPPATAADARRIDFSLRNDVRLPGLPAASVGVSHKGTGPTSSNTAFSVGLSDSYRDLSADLQGLRWQAGYRVTGRTRAGDARTSHDAQLRLDLDVTEEERSEVRFRPALSAQVRWDDTASGTRLKQSYGLSLDAQSDGEDRLGLRLDVDLTEGADVRTRQSVSYTTRELAPVALNAEFTADQYGTAQRADYHLGVGFDLTDALTVDGGYHGRTDGAGSSNGVEASANYRYTVRPWYVSARASGDLQFAADGGLDPSARLNLNLRYQGDPLNASLSTNLNYARDAWRGRVELNGSYRTAAGGFSAGAGVQLANDVSTSFSLAGDHRIADALSLQASADYRTRVGARTDRVFTLGLGLRYDFGGER